jgi:hypothetical protein
VNTNGQQNLNVQKHAPNADRTGGMRRNVLPIDDPRKNNKIDFKENRLMERVDIYTEQRITEGDIQYDRLQIM